ncbi:hypothetical protein [Nocardia suismassiliense]|uniref:hypothetical protein n=1 Tax=Nocardia suismassiliense TaxID=2077092 RepID=UPI0018FEF020|nr:hypothetical protein [Nocardia suismassiliense]
MRADNAFFYLDVVGARGYDFVPNLYRFENVGRDRGHPTDRIIASWDPTTAIRSWPAPPAGLVLGVLRIDPYSRGGAMLLAVPPAGGHGSISESREVQRHVRTLLSNLVALGYRPVSCRRAANGLAVYRFVIDPN